MPVLVTCKFEEDLIKNGQEKLETLFSLSVVNSTFPNYLPKQPVLEGPGSSQYAINPPSQQCYKSDLIQNGLLVLEIFLFSKYNHIGIIF